MKNNYDKPIYIDVKTVDPALAEASRQQFEKMVRLCGDQAFAVLATVGPEGPTASLIAFASSPKLDRIVFLTPRETAKHDHILAQPKVALLIDDRSDHPGSINRISALTLSGVAHVLDEANGRSEWTSLFLEKHPNLSEFALASSTAAILVSVTSGVYVSKFQEVFEWDLR